MKGNSAQMDAIARKRIIVVGGSAAGPKAATRARRLDEHAEIIILQKAPELSMASCGYSYYVGGVFDDRNMLICTPTGVVRNAEYFLNAKGIIAKAETEVTAIDCESKVVSARDLKTGRLDEYAYDKLILATGSKAKLPAIPGIDLQGVTTLQSMQDADYLRRIGDEQTVRKVVIVGGGLIGVETCEALHLAAFDITIVEILPQILPFLDWQLAKLIENYLRSVGVNVITESSIAAFLGENGKLAGVKLQNGTELECEVAVVAIGVTPNTELAKQAGLCLGTTGGIIVDEHMKTSDPDIYAAGGCVESLQLVTGEKVHAPDRNLANLQGRVAGENAVAGDTVSFPGTIQTGICRIFDYAAGSTGLSEEAARAAGHDNIETVVNASPDKPGFMQARLLVTKLVADKSTGRILGAQCVGPGDVSKQLAIWAMAIKGHLTVEDMVNVELPYAPPFSLAIDHSIATAHLIQNKMKGRMHGISAVEVRRKLEAGEKPFFLDVSSPEEYELSRLGIGESLIPLDTLRRHLNEIPVEREKEIICFSTISLRAYEAARALVGRGWTNVKVMEGGLKAWPYAREK